MNYFAKNYTEARQKFCEFAEILNAKCTHFKHPLKGKNGEDLYCDVAAIGEKNASLTIFTTSGIHGVEGYIGSAVQSRWLQKDIIKKALDNKISFVHIHALNPWGFSYDRRTNENGIDVNRNFISNFKDLPKNKGYDKYAKRIVPPKYEDIQKLFCPELPKMIKAATPGQYAHATGLYYGGKTSTWSNKIFHEILKKHDNQTSKAIFLDIHSGLGELGQMLAIPLSQESKTLYLKDWQIPLNKTDIKNNIISGDALLAFEQKFKLRTCFNASIEFGTRSAEDIVLALCGDHWFYAQNPKPMEMEKIIQMKMKDTFYPQGKNQKTFENAVINQAPELIKNIITIYNSRK